ncbi:hypothetical protein PMAYCL1PPCAC_14481, partial [Pristionchus mayeri]
KDLIEINDDESTNNQLTGKSVKREPESDPSIEIVELRKKVADQAKELEEERQKNVKCEDKYQRAVREAGKYLARVEFLEGLIDKKPVIDSEEVKELEEKIETLESKVAQYEMGLQQQQEVKCVMSIQHRKLIILQNSAVTNVSGDLRREEEEDTMVATNDNLSKKRKRNEVMEENMR